MWCISKGYLMISTSIRYRAVTANLDIYVANDETTSAMSLSPMTSMKYLHEFNSPTVSWTANGEAIVHTKGDGNCYITKLGETRLWVLVDDDTVASGEEPSDDKVLTQCIMHDSKTPYEIATKLQYIKAEPASSWRFYKVEDIIKGLKRQRTPSGVKLEDLPGAPKKRYKVMGDTITLIE